MSHSKILQDFFNLYRQKPEEHVWKWILRVLVQYGRNIKLDKDHIIDVRVLSQDPGFNGPTKVALRACFVN